MVPQNLADFFRSFFRLYLTAGLLTGDRKVLGLRPAFRNSGPGILVKNWNCAQLFSFLLDLEPWTLGSFRCSGHHKCASQRND